jgi:hypothetical protein
LRALCVSVSVQYMNPLLLLAAGAALFYGWSAFPAHVQADVWNITGSATRVLLLLALVWRVRSRALVIVSAWWCMEEASVIICSTWYIIAPWPILPGQAQCSALLHYDLAKVGAAIMAAVTLWVMRTRD